MSNQESAPVSAQQKFDETYISSSEICRQLGVSRAAIVNARRRGLLPDPIVVNDIQLYLWERETVQPYLEAWHFMLRSRRGELSA